MNIATASEPRPSPGKFWLSGGSDGRSSHLAAGWSKLATRRGGELCEPFAWAGALLPLELIRVPQTELHALTADVNVTAGLASGTSATLRGTCPPAAYLLEDFSKPLSLSGQVAHINTRARANYMPSLKPHNFSKPLSLSFRSLGNIMADELTIAVLSSLVAFIVPVAYFGSNRGSCSYWGGGCDQIRQFEAHNRKISQWQPEQRVAVYSSPAMAAWAIALVRDASSSPAWGLCRLPPRVFEKWSPPIWGSESKAGTRG